MPPGAPAEATSNLALTIAAAARNAVYSDTTVSFQNFIFVFAA